MLALSNQHSSRRAGPLPFWAEGTQKCGHGQRKSEDAEQTSLGDIADAADVGGRHRFFSPSFFTTAKAVTRFFSFFFAGSKEPAPRPKGRGFHQSLLPTQVGGFHQGCYRTKSAGATLV